MDSIRIISVKSVTTEEGERWLHLMTPITLTANQTRGETVEEILTTATNLEMFHAVLFKLPRYDNFTYRWDRVSGKISNYGEAEKHKIDPHMVVKEDFYKVDYNALEEGMKKIGAESTKQSLATEAHNLIYGDREGTYGAPDKNIQCIADFWTTYIKGKEVLTVDDVCNMMNLLKVARSKSNPEHRDNDLDSIGYILLKERIREYRREAREENTGASGETPESVK